MPYVMVTQSQPPGPGRISSRGPARAGSGPRGPPALGSGQRFATPTASLSPASTATDRARVSAAIMSRQASTSAT